VSWIRRLLFVPLLLGAAPLAAQVTDTTRIPTGVRLGLIYQPVYHPKLAVRPFTGGAGAARIEAVEAIVRRDLDFSDRFELGPVPPSLASGPVDYRAWNSLGVVFLLTGDVDVADGGLHLRLVLHDVVYGTVKETHSFRLADVGAPDFRMTVHAASDEVVRWVTGQRGFAATRVAFIRRNGDGSYSLMTVDSDGENVQEVLRSNDILMSPAFSPDGRRMAYSVGRDDGWQIVERDLASGSVRVLASRPNLAMTPSYAPDGRRIALSLWTGADTDIYDYDVARGCCLRRITTARGEDLSPTYSPDGRRLAYMSDRLGQPHIYVMTVDGRDATVISPYVYGEPGYYTSPQWSPTGSLVAFHGRSRGDFQIMVADADRPGATVQQLTQDGRSEDPSWAPNGRHLVFTGVRAEGRGLYVMDSVTGRLRPLILGGRYLVPDWSPTLLQASALAVRGP
jgi:TolB protein